MKVLKEGFKNGINMLVIGDIDVDNPSDAENLKNVIKTLTVGTEYYFEFFRESFLLEDEEKMRCRTKIPHYLNKNGKYILKREYGKEHLESIGCLIVTEGIYDQIIKMWDYFEGLVFFNPTDIFDWSEFERCYNKINPVQYGIGFVKQKYANSVFTKGPDGDHLIFVYGKEYNHELVERIIDFLSNLSLQKKN